jgi:hypothetical protein
MLEITYNTDREAAEAVGEYIDENVEGFRFNGSSCPGDQDPVRVVQERESAHLSPRAARAPALS